MEIRWSGVLLTGLVLTGLMLTGCGGLPQGRGGLSPSDLQTFSRYHQQQAAVAERGGDLNQSLQHWQVLATAEPASQRYRTEISRLQTEIDQRSTRHLNRARKRLQQGQLKLARTEFLAVLVLDPDHGEAMSALRQLTRRQMQHLETRTVRVGRANARAGNSSDVGSDQPDSRYGSSSPELQHFRQLYERRQYRQLIAAVSEVGFSGALPKPLGEWLIRAYLEVAGSLRAKGQLQASLKLIDENRIYRDRSDRNRAFSRRVRRAVADSLYDKGRSVVSANPDQAISLWEQALDYDPGYSEVRFQLEKAYRNRNHRISVE